MDKNIRAPFNFVPLSEHVCYLDDKEAEISLDIPFEDGISGTINYRITPQTPIFISDGDNTSVFSRIGSRHFIPAISKKGKKKRSINVIRNSRHFIPATSIKGCIRSVLEIMSFSKMSKEMVENSRYGYRDVSPNSNVGKIYLKKMKAGEIRCGWMRKEKNKYIIKDCGVPYKISIDEIEKAIGSGGRLRRFVSDISKGNRIVKEVKCTEDIKTAKFKYAVLEDYKENLNNIHPFALATKQKYKPAEVSYTQHGAIKGKIVLTGQSSSIIDRDGYELKRAKKFEFVFPVWEGNNKKQHIIELKDNEVNCITDFITIYSYSSDYKNWRKGELEKGFEIPVFFQIKEENGKEVISSIGLSYMYKYPYDRYIHDGIIQEQPDKSSFDIAEIIFGTTRFKHSPNDKSLALESNLKGRVQFTPAFLSDESQFEFFNAKAIMASPRASYYPLYLCNDNDQKPTWNSETVKIAGWKRYPACINNIESTKIDDKAEIEKTETFFKPRVLKNGYFEGKIRFFNLRDWELGALLSALTFHDNKECYHSLGKGKAYGYGIVKIDISNIDNPSWQGTIQTIDHYLTQYENFINKKLNTKGLNVEWQNTIQIKTLFAMAKREHEIKNLNEFFTYMSIQQDRTRINEFVDAKKNKLYLPTFLDIIKPKWPPIVGEYYNAYIKKNIVDIWHPSHNKEYNIEAEYVLAKKLTSVSGRCKVHILKIEKRDGKDIYTLEIIN